MRDEEDWRSIKKSNHQFLFKSTGTTIYWVNFKELLTNKRQNWRDILGQCYGINSSRFSNRKRIKNIQFFGIIVRTANPLATLFIYCSMWALDLHIYQIWSESHFVCLFLVLFYNFRCIIIYNSIVHWIGKSIDSPVIPHRNILKWLFKWHRYNWNWIARKFNLTICKNQLFPKWK